MKTAFVSEQKGEPKECDFCGSRRYTEWANLSHEYKRNLDDWVSLCKPCHRDHDSGENWGKGVKKFGKENMQGYARKSENETS